MNKIQNMNNYPLHFYLGAFNPMLRIHKTLFCDLHQSHPDIAIVAYPDDGLDADDVQNMLGIYQIPETKIHVLPKINTNVILEAYLHNAERVFCDFYEEKEKWLLHSQSLHKQYEAFYPKINWIEIAEEHKHISSKTFWEAPEQHHRWIHPDVYTLFVKNKILV